MTSDVAPEAVDLSADEVQRELRGLVEIICHLNGGQQAVADILTERLGYSVSKSRLNHALSLNQGERRRHPIRGDWLVVLATLKGGRSIAEYFAQMCGGQVIDDVPLTPVEEVISMYEAARTMFGPDVETMFRTRATEIGRRRRGFKRAMEGK